MKPPVSRCRRKAPAHAPRRMELLGLGRDGGLYFWQVGMVRPVDRFPMEGGRVQSAHYIIERHGVAITVHIGNLADGRVSVQYMCGGVATVYLPPKAVEPMLLGIVVPDAEAEAKLLQLMQDAMKALEARDTAPERRRYPVNLFPPGQHPRLNSPRGPE